MSMNHTSAIWLRQAVNREGVAAIVKEAVKALKVIEFDTIAFRGISGALIAPIVAHKLKKEIVLIRKPESQSHSYDMFEGFLRTERYVIIDDLVCSGSTVSETIKKVTQNVPGAKFVGVYLYHDSAYGEGPGYYPADEPAQLLDRVRLHMSATTVEASSL